MLAQQAFAELSNQVGRARVDGDSRFVARDDLRIVLGSVPGSDAAPQGMGMGKHLDRLVDLRDVPGPVSRCIFGSAPLR